MLEILEDLEAVVEEEVLPHLTSVFHLQVPSHIVLPMEMLVNRAQRQLAPAALVAQVLPVVLDKTVLVELKEILEQRGKLIPHLMETQDSLIPEILEMLEQQDKHQLHLELLFLVASAAMVELEIRELPAMVELEMGPLRDLLEMLAAVEVKVAAAVAAVLDYHFPLPAAPVVLVVQVEVLLEILEVLDLFVLARHTQQMCQLLVELVVLELLRVVLVDLLLVTDLLHLHR